MPEGQYFIEPIQKSPDEPAGTPEPHVIYPRVSTESHRKKRSLESKETPSPCGVQGAYVNVCVYTADVCVIVHKWVFFCQTRISNKCTVMPSMIPAVDAPSDSVQVEREREEWEREQQREEGRVQSRSRRSVSRERWVETMVVADSKLIEYHGSDNVESYIFTIMNMVRS